MLALIGGIRGILVAMGGAGIAFVLFLAWNTVWDNPRLYADAYAAGEQAEKAAWVEARNKLLTRMDQERREAQIKIDAIERGYLAQRQRDASAIQSLETAITEMESADEQVADDTCPSRPAIPRRLRDAIDKVGRDTD